MYGSMWTSSVGMSAGSDRMDVTAHNIANINSDGFRRHLLDFVELTHVALAEQNPATILQPVVTGTPEVDPAVLARGHGVRARPVDLDEGSGPVRRTGVPGDLAIGGGGYFALGDAAGDDPIYTRLGAFRLDADSHLVHPGGGYLLDADGEPIQIPEGASGDVSVSSDGKVSVPVIEDGEESISTLGQIVLALPQEGARLAPLGDGTYDLLDEDGETLEPELEVPGDAGAGRIISGHLEGSNVDMSAEMLEMILAQRAFQLNGRVLQAVDEMLQGATDLRR